MPCTLAFDTTTFDTGVGVVGEDGLCFELFDIPQGDERPGHASKSLALAEEVLQQGGFGWPDVAAVAVAVGPGSFTGLRVGIATAKALALGLGVEVFGASSLQALVAGAQSAGHSGAVSALIDARRGELFVTGMRSGEEDRILNPSKSDGWLNQLPVGCLCVGNGAVLHREKLLNGGFQVPTPESHLHRISPIRVAGVALDWDLAREVLPHYVREADAVPTSDRQKGNQR